MSSFELSAAVSAIEDQGIRCGIHPSDLRALAEGTVIVAEEIETDLQIPASLNGGCNG